VNILIVVSHPDAINALTGLTAACLRQQHSYTCFFTGDGVTLLQNQQVVNVTADAKKAVVCEYSWERHFKPSPSVVEKGSQTDLSAMMCTADKVVSL